LPTNSIRKMSIASSRRRVAELAAWALVLFSLGVVAWSPVSRPAKTPPKIHAPNERHPFKWAATGFLVATLAFTPVNSNAAANELPVAAGDNTAVKVQVETDSLIRSIEENGGQLNRAISDLVKDIPSVSIELDPPEEKAQAVRAVIKEDTGEEQKMTPSVEKATIVEEKVIDEPKVVEQVDKTQTESATDATAATIVEKKAATEEAQVAEKALETPEKAAVIKVDEIKKEEPKLEMTKESPKEEPKVEETKEATKLEMMREAPKEEPKVGKAKEAPKVEMSKEVPKEEAKLEKTKVAPNVVMNKEAPKEDVKLEKTKVASKVQMTKEAPKEAVGEARKSVMIEAAKSVLAQITDQLESAKLEKMKVASKVQITREAPKEEVGEAKKSVIIDAAKSVLAPATNQLQDSGSNQFMNDLTENLRGRMGTIARFWNSPSGVDIKIPPTGSHPEGQTFELTRLNVAGISLLGLGASYYVSYEYYNYENEQEEIKAKKKKADIKAKLAAKKKDEKAAKPKKAAVKGATKPRPSSFDSRCETTSQELLATAMADVAAEEEVETVIVKAPDVSPNGTTAPVVSPNGASAPSVSPKVVTAPAASRAQDSTMDAFAQALAAMSNPAGPNGQKTPPASAEESTKPEKDSPPVARSGSSYLDSLSRR
jgi:hypothetical protein